MEKIKLTREGLKSLEDERYEINNKKLPEARLRLNEARSLGDLSENAEYDAAREEVQNYETRLQQINSTLGNYELINEDSIKKDVVDYGLTVRVKDLTFNEELEYKIVSKEEADLNEGKIDACSPLGKCMMKKKVGSTVSYEAPCGKVEIKILSIK